MIIGVVRNEEWSGKYARFRLYGELEPGERQRLRVPDIRMAALLECGVDPFVPGFPRTEDEARLLAKANVLARGWP